MYSAVITVFPSDEGIRECLACIGIEAQPFGGAPRREFFRYDIHLFDNSPAAFKALQNALSTLQPIIVGEV